MKVQEIMERAGINITGKAVAYIRDALEEINLISETHIRTLRQEITKDQRYYNIPLDAVKITSIRCKNHLNTKDEYRKIPRMIGDPYTEDADQELI
jgi:hypothetical protein|tara:strand:+ start:401 stop:688 length:288 start_codon:yes stop_codon:yes gene_type:complete